jgi:glucose/arabinose dehydrogenase
LLLAFLVAPAQGQLTREAATTLQMPQAPARRGYSLQQAFGQTFGQAVAIATPPGETNRLFVVDKTGAIVALTNITLAVPPRKTFLTLPPIPNQGEQGLLGLAFHPGYRTNGYFYIFYTAQGGFNRLSRFQVSATDPSEANPASETVLINQQDDYGNHNGGDLHFGPDGYLYVALGDEGSGGDAGQNSQKIDKDFFSGILRIDVDKRPENLPANTHAAASTNYFVPADNPFVGATHFNGVRLADTNKARTEFWATGLRNPWRMSFDSLTGELWCGDVGQDLWEEIDVITKGGNYGWKYREGFHAYSGTPPAGFAGIDPVYEYRHESGNVSVTGGVVYRGNRLSQLYGAYIFADYGSGRTWSLRRNATGPATVELLTSNSGAAGFGIDPSNGDILVANVNNGTIRRLIYSAASTGTPIPEKLSQTGAFADLAALTPNAGIVPYELNLPFWSDGAAKKRWFAITNTNQTMTFNATNAWLTPTSGFWIKHFELAMTNGDPASARRLETRFIVRNTNGVYGVTYRWTNATEAVLVPEEGLNETLTISEGGTNRTQLWRYPGRAECLACHNEKAGWVLGFNTPQMNRDVTHGAVTTNQIKALAHAGYLANPPTAPQTLPALAPPTDANSSQEFRVRSYLAANCANCHVPGGLANGNFDARLSTPTDAAKLIHGALVSNAEKWALEPNDLAASEIYRRMSIRGPGRMPPLASNVADAEGVELMRSFILGDLTNRQSFAQWQVAQFGEPLPADAAAGSDADGDGASNMLEYFTYGNPQAGGDAWTITVTGGESVEVAWPNPANRGVVIEKADSLPGRWEALDVESNRPLFPALETNRSVIDLAPAETTRFYRARIMAP